MRLEKVLVLMKERMEGSEPLGESNDPYESRKQTDEANKIDPKDWSL